MLGCPTNIRNTFMVCIPAAFSFKGQLHVSSIHHRCASCTFLYPRVFSSYCKLSYMYMYVPFMWTACNTGIDGRRFPLCSHKTPSDFMEFMRPSIPEQNSRLLSFLKKGSNCWWCFRYEVIVISSL